MDESESNNGAPWWRHDMETLSALLAFSEGNLPSEPPAKDSNAGICGLRC